MRTARISVDATVPCLQLYMELPCWQVRRPEDVGTPDSEAKGRNHPLYFVGSQDLSCDLNTTPTKIRHRGQRRILSRAVFDWCCFDLKVSEITPEISCVINKVSEEPDNDFPVRPVACLKSPLENKFWSILRFAKCFPPRRFEPSARRICRTFTTLLPWMRTLCLGCRHLRQRDVQCPKSLQCGNRPGTGLNLTTRRIRYWAMELVHWSRNEDFSISITSKCFLFIRRTSLLHRWSIELWI